MEIFKNIEKLRKQRGYSQEIIANALSTDVSVVSNIEKGKRPVKFFEIEIIANVLGVDPLYLITYPEIYVKKQDDLLKDSTEINGNADKDKVISVLEERVRFQESLINELLTKIK